jgi:hypothetical protein
VNVIEIFRFFAMLMIVGGGIRLVELLWANTPGIRGQVAEGLGVIY